MHPGARIVRLFVRALFDIACQYEKSLFFSFPRRARALNRNETTLPNRVKLLDFGARQIFAGSEIDTISIAGDVAVENCDRPGNTSKEYPHFLAHSSSTHDHLSRMIHAPVNFLFLLLGCL